MKQFIQGLLAIGVNMDIEKPNYHLFMEAKKHFLYDVNINSIVSISEELYHFLDEWDDDLKRKIPESLKDSVQFLLKHGYLSGKRKINHILHYETDIMVDLLKNNMSMMILQVTQNCNLRCNYCV